MKAKSDWELPNLGVSSWTQTGFFRCTEPRSRAEKSLSRPLYPRPSASTFAGPVLARAVSRSIVLFFLPERSAFGTVVACRTKASPYQHDARLRLLVHTCTTAVCTSSRMTVRYTWYSSSSSSSSSSSGLSLDPEPKPQTIQATTAVPHLWNFPARTLLMIMIRYSYFDSNALVASVFPP